MASAKKAKSRKTVARPSRKQRKLEKVATPEELLEQLDAAGEEHDVEVRALGKKLIAVMRRANYHPSVALDTLQILLAEGIGAALGEDQKKLFTSHLHAFHEDSKMLSVVQMIGGSLADLIVDPGTEDETSAATPEPGGPTDYAQGT